MQFTILTALVFFSMIGQLLLSTYSYAQCTVKAFVEHASCNGQANGSIRLQVTGTPPYKYEWSNGANTQNITELNPGVYEVKVTDGRGNFQEQQIEVNDNSSLTIAKKTIISPGQTGKDGLLEVAVTGGTAPYSYFLSNYSDLKNIKKLKQSSEVFKGLSKGRYIIDVMDSKGCMASLSINLK